MQTLTKVGAVTGGLTTVEVPVRKENLSRDVGVLGRGSPDLFVTERRVVINPPPILYNKEATGLDISWLVRG